MPKGMEGHNPYDENFLTPMAERRRGSEPGPELLSAPLFSAPDPLGYAKTANAGKDGASHSKKQGNNKNTAKRK